MKQNTKRISALAVVALLLSFIRPAAQAQILFQDDFQSDPATTTLAGGDFDPVIGAGDIGGSWTIREFGASYLQVLNDTVPGNNTAGSGNFVSIYRDSSNARNGGAYASGWDTALTLNQVVQLDFKIWQSQGDLTVPFLSQGPPSGPGSYSSGNVSPWLDMTLTDSTWHSVSVRANYDSSLTQLGIAPQTYTISIDGGAPTTGSFFTPQNSVQTVGFHGGANFTTVYFDDVLLQVVPEPSTFVLAGFGLAGLMLLRRRV